MRVHGSDLAERGAGDSVSWPDMARLTRSSTSYGHHATARSYAGRPLMASPNRPSEPAPEPDSVI